MVPLTLVPAEYPSADVIPRKRRTPTLDILRELWAARDLVSEFLKRDITIRYSQAVIGLAWALLMPLLIVCSGLVFRLVVSMMSGAPVGGAGAASLAVKSLPWAFFAGAISLSTQSIISHASLIGKVYFAREALPVASVLAQGLDLLIGAAALLIALPLLGVHLHLSALWAPVLLVMLVLFTIGCALLLSCWNLFFRDVKYLVQVVLNFGIFATPVFFEPQMLGPDAARILMALPLSPFIEALDLAVVRGHSLLSPVVLQGGVHSVTVWSPWMFGYMLALTGGVLFAGLRVFRNASSRFAEVA